MDPAGTADVRCAVSADFAYGRNDPEGLFLFLFFRSRNRLRVRRLYIILMKEWCKTVPFSLVKAKKPPAVLVEAESFSYKLKKKVHCSKM